MYQDTCSDWKMVRRNFQVFLRQLKQYSVPFDRRFSDKCGELNVKPLRQGRPSKKLRISGLLREINCKDLGCGSIEGALGIVGGTGDIGFRSY